MSYVTLTMTCPSCLQSHAVALELPLAEGTPYIFDCPRTSDPVPVESDVEGETVGRVPEGVLQARIAE
jgi:hypothetical protein